MLCGGGRGHGQLCFSSRHNGGRGPSLETIGAAPTGRNQSFPSLYFPPGTPRLHMADVVENRSRRKSRILRLLLDRCLSEVYTHMSFRWTIGPHSIDCPARLHPACMLLLPVDGREAAATILNKCDGSRPSDMKHSLGQRGRERWILGCLVISNSRGSS